MNEIAVKTYILNFFQIVSMGAFTILVPFYVGLDNYGLYAAVFAVPGILSALYETSLVINKKIDYVFVFYTSFAGVCLNWFLFDFGSAINTLLIICVLFLRGVVYTNILKLNSTEFSVVYRNSELFSIISFFTMFLFLHLVGADANIVTFLLFHSMNLSFVIFGFLYLKRHFMFNLPKHDNSKGKIRNVVKMCTYRIYEDYVFTFSPVIVALSGGASLAGEFKLYTSIMKLFIKFYPVRYETFKKEGYFDSTKFFDKVTFVNFSLVIFLSLLAFVFFHYNLNCNHYFSIKINYDYLMFVIGFSFVAYIFAVSPRVSAKYKIYTCIVLLLLFVMTLIAVIKPELYGVTVFSSSVLLYVLLRVYFIKGLE